MNEQMLENPITGESMPCSSRPRIRSRQLINACAVVGAIALWGCAPANRVIELTPKDYKMVSEGQGSQRTMIKKPAQPAPVYRVAPLPIDLGPELMALTERARKGPRSMYEFQVGQLLSCVFAVTNKNDSRGTADYVTSVLTMDGSAAFAVALGGGLLGLAIAGGLTDLAHGEYTLTIALNVNSQRWVVTGRGVESARFDEVEATQRAVESAILSLHGQVAAILEKPPAQ